MRELLALAHYTSPENHRATKPAKFLLLVFRPCSPGAKWAIIHAIKRRRLKSNLFFRGSSGQPLNLNFGALM
jgi:hypothetical protein